MLSKEIRLLVDRAADLERDMKDMKVALDAIKAKLQADALQIMENTNTKYVEFFGNHGTSVFVCYKEKFDVDNLPLLKEIFGDVLDGKVTREETVKYSLDNKVKKAILALYSQRFANNDILSLLQQDGLDAKDAKAAMKKLKGDYAKDLQVLRSFGVDVSDGAEEQLDTIMETKNYELIEKFINPADVDINKLKRAVSVEESLSIGIIYDVEAPNEGTDDRTETD